MFAHRLFRESCVYDRGNYVKDLSKLGREMKRTIIIDNSPASYLFQPQNAIPCSSWFDDKNDTLLKGTCLLKYHKKLLEKPGKRISARVNFGTRTSAQISKNFITFGTRNHFTLCRS